MKLCEIRHNQLAIDHWTLGQGSLWCVLGTDGSGKTTLGRLLVGEIAPQQGRIEPQPTRARLVSLESQQALYEQELLRDQSDWLDGVDEGRTGQDLLAESGASPEAIASMSDALGLTPLQQRGYRRLSSGEARALLIAQALLYQPDLLVLDQPFEGLDPQARQRLLDAIERAHARELRIVVIVSRREDVPKCVSHMALLHRGQLLAQGTRTEVLEQPEVVQLWSLSQLEAHHLPPPPNGTPPPTSPLLQLHRCQVRYGDEQQFEPLSWTLEPGQHTLITGQNGCGKSTLLQLLSGDHPQCYENEMEVFGYKRGSGESIWDIKQHIGIMSSALHRDYRVGGNVLMAVLSGLYDTIGVYRSVPAQDRELALRFLKVLGMGASASMPLKQLSYGQQRLVLIARALIKQPPLLILDEPTQGLDELNRHLVLSFIEQLSELKRTTMLFVSHREDEHLPVFKNQLHFVKSDQPQTRYRIELRTRHSDGQR